MTTSRDAGAPGEAADAGVRHDACEIRVVLVTAPSEEAAAELVGTLVQERVAACGTVLPGALSIYRWQGAIQRQPEALVLLKTTAPRVPALLERLPALHPYEVPEVLVLPVSGGHSPYLEWVAACVETLQERD